MPIDQTAVAINICSKLQDAAENIMKGLEQLEMIKDQISSTGIDLSSASVQTALEKSALKHADGAAFTAVVTSGDAIKTWVEANFHHTNLNKVRSGTW